MAWKKSSAEAVERFVGALPTDAAGGRRKMFGYEACFVNGGFWAGMYQEEIVIKLPPEVKAQTAELSAAKQFDPMGGRPMKNWWIVPRPVSESPKKLSALLVKTYGPVSAAPPQKKAKNPPTKSKSKAKR